MTLTDLEQQILTFEHGRWNHVGAKEQAITDQFGMTTTRYHQLLNRLIDNPAALVADPMLVKRLRRLRDTRRQTRRSG